MAVRLDVEITGIAQVLEELGYYRGDQLSEAAAKGISRGLQRAAVPALKAAAPVGGPHDPWTRLPSGSKKKGGPLNRKISVRKVRKRPGEMAALKVGPNTWYDSWPITGTKPHVITARDFTHGRATSRQVRQMNRGRALLFNGIFAERVMHPGAKPNNWVGRVAQNSTVQGAIKAAILEELHRKQTLRKRK